VVFKIVLSENAYFNVLYIRLERLEQPWFKITRGKCC